MKENKINLGNQVRIDWTNKLYFCEIRDYIEIGYDFNKLKDLFETFKNDVYKVTEIITHNIRNTKITIFKISTSDKDWFVPESLIYLRPEYEKFEISKGDRE